MLSKAVYIEQSKIMHEGVTCSVVNKIADARLMDWEEVGLARCNVNCDATNSLYQHLSVFLAISPRAVFLLYLKPLYRKGGERVHSPNDSQIEIVYIVSILLMHN